MDLWAVAGNPAVLHGDCLARMVGEREIRVGIDELPHESDFAGVAALAYDFPADVTDDDIDQAIEYAKKASEDPSNNYTYNQETADQVRKTIEDKRTEAQKGSDASQDYVPDQGNGAQTEPTPGTSQDAAGDSELVGDAIEMDLVHNDRIDAADVPMWYYECPYFTCMLSDELEGVVDFEVMGHTSGAYHVDGYLHGTRMMVMRFDGMAGERTATLTFMPGGANVIWSAINNGSCEGVSASDASRYLAALSYNEMSASDAKSLDKTAFVNRLVQKTRSFQGPVIAASFQVIAN